MKVFIITLFAAAFLSVEASPKPGGYTLKGGVNYKLQENKPVGHFNAAKAAGRSLKYGDPFLYYILTNIFWHFYIITLV